METAGHRFSAIKVNVRSRLKVFASASAAGVVSLPAWAAAPVLFDIEGLIVSVGLYVVALPLIFGIAVIKRSQWIFALFLAVLLSPIWLYWLDSWQTEAYQARLERTHELQVEAYRKMCSRAKFTGSAADPAEGISLLFSRSGEGPAAEREFSGTASVTAHLIAKQNLCASTGIRYTEARRAVTGETHLIDRYELACPQVVHTVVEAPAAKFGLVVGEEAETVVAPGEVPWGRTDLRSRSVRIFDLRSGKTLARDVVYSASWPSAKMLAACPDESEAIASLVVRTFPRR